jgi:hypothetical protein
MIPEKPDLGLDPRMGAGFSECSIKTGGASLYCSLGCDRITAGPDVAGPAHNFRVNSLAWSLSPADHTCRKICEKFTVTAS